MIVFCFGAGHLDSEQLRCISSIIDFCQPLLSTTWTRHLDIPKDAWNWAVLSEWGRLRWFRYGNFQIFLNEHSGKVHRFFKWKVLDNESWGMIFVWCLSLIIRVPRWWFQNGFKFCSILPRSVGKSSQLASAYNLLFVYVSPNAVKSPPEKNLWDLEIFVACGIWKK